MPGFSASGPGGAIPDPAATPGAWNVAYGGTRLSSSITLVHPVASVSSLMLSGLQHGARGDLHVLLRGPQGTSNVAGGAPFGDAIPPGSPRCYQACYRDPSGSFRPAPSGATFNITNAVAITW